MPGFQHLISARMACTWILAVSGLACGGDDGPIDDTVVYVSITGNDEADGESPAAAFASIQRGIDRALTCEPEPCTVHISGGEFVGALTLGSGVGLRGGYRPDFQKRQLDTEITTIRAQEVRTVIADGLTAPTTVDGVHVRGADFSELVDGQSNYALWVRDSGELLRIINGTVIGGTAANGAHGAGGEARECEARGGAGGQAYDCGGVVGQAGEADGDELHGGAGGGFGDSNCPNACPLVGADGISDGQPGADGVDGADGQSGASGRDPIGRFVAGAWMGDEGEGGRRGYNGTGGGGGGSGGSKRFRACFGCDTLFGGRGGDGAPGGCGATGGQPGGAGGSSFGLVLIDSRVALHNVTIQGGVAGQGGRGGDGHPGGTGASDGSIGQQGRGSQQCGAITYYAGAGGTGGAGGDGGHGGGGAGGIGGISVGIALVGDAGTIDGDDITVEAGEPGRSGYGGFGGATNGEDGLPGIAEPIMSWAHLEDR